jgi:YD repeat-containing protein
VRKASRTRSSVTLSDQSNPLSLTSATDTATIGGRIWKSSFNAPTRRFTNTAPSGRTRTTDVDAQSRPRAVSVPGVDQLTATYDSRGRLAQQQQGSRVWAYGYDPAGDLESITDPVGCVNPIGHRSGGSSLARNPVGCVNPIGHRSGGSSLARKPPAEL